MAPGAGLVKSGENGRGLRSRWYPGTLSRRILDIAKHGERFSFSHRDGLELIEAYMDDDEAVFLLIRRIQDRKATLPSLAN